MVFWEVYRRSGLLKMSFSDKSSFYSSKLKFWDAARTPISDIFFFTLKIGKLAISIFSRSRSFSACFKSSISSAASLNKTSYESLWKLVEIAPSAALSLSVVGSETEQTTVGSIESFKNSFRRV
jgi:hypothetical protein